MTDLLDSIRTVLGLNAEARDLTFLQVSLRGIIVFIFSLAMVRVANRRFLSKMTAFDAILGFIMASMLARAINGSAPFFPTLGAGFVLVGLHALIAKVSFHSDWFGFLVKGRSETIVRDGKLERGGMSRSSISEKDLLEEARLNGRVASLEEIKLATLERNGAVSVIPKK